MEITSLSALRPEHQQHLLDEGFTLEQIATLESWGVRSITQAVALALGLKKWDGAQGKHLSGPGLYFSFTDDYGQIRFDAPSGALPKYLGPAKSPPAWVPPATTIHGCEAATEGYKDAAMPTLRGVATAAVVGVSNIVYSLPRGWGKAIIFDSDGWENHAVVDALLTGAIWTHGRINLFPEMAQYPKGGACEFFKAGGTIEGYRALIDAAMKPVDFIQEWVKHWGGMTDIGRMEAARVACKWVYRLQHATDYMRSLDAKLADHQKDKGLRVSPAPAATSHIYQVTGATAKGLLETIRKASGLGSREFKADIQSPAFDTASTDIDQVSKAKGDQVETSRNSWDDAPVSWQGQIGKMETIDGVTRFTPRTNFDFQIERELCSPDGEGDSGLVLQVQRSIDKFRKRVTVRSVDRVRPDDFIEVLTKAYGRELSCNLSKFELNALFHVRLQEYHDRGGKVFKLASRVGRQSDGHWVFPDRQLTPSGDICTEDQSGWVFNDSLTCGEDIVPAPQIAPPGKDGIKNLVDATARFFGPETIDAAIFTMGWGAAAIQYGQVMEKEGRFPILNPIGDPGSFKTIMGELALSLAGNHRHLLAKSTESALYERLRLSGSIPQCYDDPTRARELDEMFKRLYNGKPRITRLGTQKPNSPIMVTSNHAVGDGQAATRTRIISVPCFPTNQGDSSAWDDLQAAMDSASSQLPDLIKLGYPAQEIRAEAASLRPLVPNAHLRIADSLGLVLWYAKAVARLAGYPEASVDRYVRETLCRYANDSGTNRSSLDEFLEHIQVLHAQDKIGGWNCIAVCDRKGQRFIAVHLPSAWETVDRTFSPMYSKEIISNAIDKAGGHKGATQKFYRSMDELKTYRRALLSPVTDTFSAPPTEPERVPRKCVVIPASLAPDFYEAIIPPQPEDLDVPSEAPPVTFEPPPVTSVTPQLPPKGNSPNPGEASVSDDNQTPVTKIKKECTEGKLNYPSDSGNKLGAGKGEAFSKEVTQPSAAHPSPGEVSVLASYQPEVTGGNSASNSPSPIAPGCKVRWGTSLSPWLVVSIEGDQAQIQNTLNGFVRSAPLAALEEVAA